MNSKDAKMILALLQTEYPQSFSKLDDLHIRAKANLWAELFADDPPQLVLAAVKSIVAGEAREFAPSAGEIKTKMHDLTSEPTISETEAWALVSKACANGIYGYEAEFAKLPPDVQAAVGRPEQLKEWGMMDAETVQSVVASNFMRGFKAVQKREKEIAMLPDSVKTLIGGVADKLMLESGATNGKDTNS